MLQEAFADFYFFLFFMYSHEKTLGNLTYEKSLTIDKEMSSVYEEMIS